MSILKEIEEFEKQFEEQTCDIIAVTGANGVGGGKSKGEELWTAGITLTAWKLSGKGEKIHKEEKRLQIKADDAKLASLQEQINKESVVKLRVRDGGSRFLLVEVLESPYKDKELLEILKEQKKPVYFDDVVLGKFILDKSVNWFEMQTEWRGRLIHLTFEQAELQETKNALNTAHHLFDKQKEWDASVRKFAAEELLELKNDNWLEEHEAALTKEEFENRIEINSIGVSPDGDFEFWFDDGDIFWGHSIRVEGNIEEGLISADLEG